MRDPCPIEGAVLARATAGDAAEVLVLQRCCAVELAIENGTFEVPPMHETLDDIRSWIATDAAWVVRLDGRLIGAARGSRHGDAWEVGRLMVAPDLARRGLGRWLLSVAEQSAPPDVPSLVLFTGVRSDRKRTMYERAGYVITSDPAPPFAVWMAKPRAAR